LEKKEHGRTHGLPKVFNYPLLYQKQIKLPGPSGIPVPEFMEFPAVRHYKKIPSGIPGNY